MSAAKAEGYPRIRALVQDTLEVPVVGSWGGGDCQGPDSTASQEIWDG